MKTWLKYAASILIVLLLSVYLLLYWGDRPCALCDSTPFHGLCLVNIEDGSVYELTVYEPDPFRPGALSDLQFVDTLSFLSLGELVGVRNTGSFTASVSVPIQSGHVQRLFFCNRCCEKLQNHASVKYILADLYTPQTPVLYPLTGGTVFTARCYEVSIAKDTQKAQLDVQVQGHLDISGYATNQTGLPRP